MDCLNVLAIVPLCPFGLLLCYFCILAGDSKLLHCLLTIYNKPFFPLYLLYFKNLVKVEKRNVELIIKSDIVSLHPRTLYSMFYLFWRLPVLSFWGCC